MSEDQALEKAGVIKLIVGLGNPGPNYAGNRHNIGFMVLDEFLKGRAEKTRQRCQSELTEALVGDRPVLFQKPLTFMNLSGDAVKKLCRRENISPAEVLVVYDDLDLKPGRLRVRFGGGSGGHNGIKSITARLGTADFGRLRLGIGRPAGSSYAVADYVLQNFTTSENDLRDKMTVTAGNVMLMLCNEGYRAAMNQFNGVELTDSDQPNQE
jgi:PTH1 family peptidyl-tRNA hydrolase